MDSDKPDPDPAKSAYYEREIAKILQREQRAADLLDPEGSFDQELPGGI